jgi:hypothetical protein
METKMWLVRIAALTVVGTATWSAGAQTPPAAPAKPDEAGKEKPVDDSEGPFAPKGKTGKLKEATPSADAKGDEATAAPPPAEKPGMAGVDLVYGFGSAGTSSEGMDLAVASFIIGGAYQVTPAIGLRLRFPLATGKITETSSGINTTYGGPSGGYNAAAFGNLEVAGNYTVDMGPRTKLPIELAFTPPTSNGDYFRPSDDKVRGGRYRVNTAAQVSRGMEEDALFASHRFGIIPGARLRFRGTAIETGAFLKVPILIRAGGEDPRNTPSTDPNAPVYTLNSTVIEVVAGGSFYYGIVANKIDLGLRAWVAAMSAEFIDSKLPGATGPDKIQFVLEPQVRGSFGPVRPALGFIWPIGGRLGGDPAVKGLRIDLGVVF